MLTPDLKLPGKMRLKEVAPRADVERPHRMPLFRFDMVKGTARARTGRGRRGAAPG
jgi:putative N6-adenine-specific DNA methylase